VLTQTRETTTGYRVTFHEDTGEPPYIQFDCDYLEQSSWGILTSVTVRTNIPTSRRLPDGVVLIDRINLLRGRDLKDMAFRIDTLINPPASSARQDWLRHLEHAAVLINAELQKPVPHMDLTDMALPERQRFDIAGILAKGKTNILYGPGGTGKSVLAVRIAASLSSGQDFVGFDTLYQGGTLYLDWEDTADTMVRRLEEVSNGMGLPVRTPLLYKSLHGKGPYERHHADIKHALRENPGISLIIFDSTAMAMHGSSQGDGADGAIKFFNLIAQLPVTRLLIDHVASDDLKKSDGNGATKPYGSVFKVNSARNMWEVQPWNAEKGGMGLTMKHRKTNVGPRMDNAEVQVVWSDDAVTFKRMTQEEADWEDGLN